MKGGGRGNCGQCHQWIEPRGGRDIVRFNWGGYTTGRERGTRAEPTGFEGDYRRGYYEWGAAAGGGDSREATNININLPYSGEKTMGETPGLGKGQIDQGNQEKLNRLIETGW